MLTFRTQQTTFQAKSCARPVVAPRAIRCRASQKQVVAQEEPTPRRDFMAAMMALSGGIMMGPMASPPGARADEGADKRKAEKARRKAILAASRAKAEADLAAPKPDGKQEADAKVDAANAERQRLAAERIAAVKDQRDAEYAKQADRAVKEVPPV